VTPEEVNEIRLSLRGVPSITPLWLSILEAAHFNPLEAQRIEQELEPYWWQRYTIYHDEYVKFMRERERKSKLGNR